MSTHEELPPELKAIEAELSSLAPRPDTIDEARLMYQAGRASVEGPRRSARLAWPSAFAAMTAVAAILLAVVMARPAPRVIERVVHVPVDRTNPPESVNPLPSPDADPRQAPEPADTAPQRPQIDWPRALASAGWTGSGRSTYPQLRDQLLHDGLDAWQASVSPSEGGTRDTPANYRSWARELLQ